MSWLLLCVFFYSRVLGREGSPCVLSELRGQLWYRLKGGTRRGTKGEAPPKRQRRQRQGPETSPSTMGQAPVTSRIRGDQWGAKPAWPQILEQGVNSTLLSTQFISVSCSSSELGCNEMNESEGQIKTWGGEDQLWTEAADANRLKAGRWRCQWWERVN